MARQERRVSDRAAVTGPTAAKPKRGKRPGLVLLAVGPVFALLGSVLLGIGWYGLDVVLRVAGVVALLIVAAGAAAVGALALVLRRRLNELRHLPDLGRRYVTNHEDGVVTGLMRDSAGNIVLEVASGSRQTIVMDEDGAPDHITAGGGTVARWSIQGTAQAWPEVLERLEALVSQQVPVRLVSEGAVALAGPVQDRWRLEAEDGLVVTSRS